MKFLLLAAGVGERISSRTNNTPKCFLSVGGRPILDHILEAIDPQNKESKFIVIGKEGLCWQGDVGKRFCSYPLQLIYNDKNVQMDNAHSLFLGLRKIRGEGVVFSDADIIFSKKIFSALLRSKHENVLLSRPIKSKKERGGRIRIDPDDRVIEIGESVFSDGPLYIYAGIAKISKELNAYLRKNLVNKNKIVDALNDACKKFDIYNMIFTGDKDWININNITKLREARRWYGK